MRLQSLTYIRSHLLGTVGERESHETHVRRSCIIYKFDNQSGLVGRLRKPFCSVVLAFKQGSDVNLRLRRFISGLQI